MQCVEALIFDIDDTLYPFACGFTTHRNGEMVERFMVEKLGFADRPSAKALRDEYPDQDAHIDRTSFVTISANTTFLDPFQHS